MSHLVGLPSYKNLGEALEGVLARHLAAQRRGVASASAATPLPEAPSQQRPKVSPKAAHLQQAKREERLSRYQQVITLHQQGFSQTAIADQVGIGHATVSRWLAHGAFPEQQPRPRKTGLDSHLPDLEPTLGSWLPYYRPVISGTGGPWLHPIVSVGV